MPILRVRWGVLYVPGLWTQNKHAILMAETPELVCKYPEGSWPRLTLVSQRPQCDQSSWEASSDVLCQRV